MVVIRNCRMIAELCEDTNLRFSDIVVDGGLIKSILPANTATVSNDDLLIDAGGKTLLPGLINLHVHLIFYNEHAPNEVMQMDSTDAVFKAYEYAKELVKMGFTTVRDVGSDMNSAIGVSKAIAKGIINGPRILASGLIVTPTEKGNDSFKGMYAEADGPYETEKACRKEFKKGAHFIKMMGSGAFLNEGGVPTQPLATKDEFEAAVRVATSKDSYVAAHCHSTETIKLAIKSGVRTIEHGSFMDDECIEMLLEETAYVVPTISTLLYYADAQNAMSVQLRSASHKLGMKFKTFECLRKGYEAGLKYAWGDDLHKEIWLENPGYEFLIRAKHLGCSNIDMLKQATIYSAKAASVDDTRGSIKVGKYADLILVDGNPDDDINVMTKLPTMVMVGGKLIDFN